MTDANSFEAFMQTYQNMVFSTAQRLVANAADAMDRRRFEALTNPAMALPADAKIRLVPDKDASTLLIDTSPDFQSQAAAAGVKRVDAVLFTHVGYNLETGWGDVTGAGGLVSVEYAFHGAVHGRLTRVSRVGLESANEFIYTHLFMTPRKDAWLGLTSTTALTGIDDDGLVAAGTVEAH